MGMVDMGVRINQYEVFWESYRNFDIRLQCRYNSEKELKFIDLNFKIGDFYNM